MFRVYFGKRKFSSKYRLYDVLKFMPGVGKDLILGLFRRLGISIHVRIRDLDDARIQQATDMVSHLCSFEDLKRYRLKLLKLHLKYGTYRGIRLRQGLPRNGQRTHSNAKNPRKNRGKLF